MNEFYVYKWFRKSNNEVFYIGKGKNQRYKNTTHRNDYFKNIIHKYPDDVDVAFVQTNLSEEAAFALEKKLIAEYKAKGQCYANFHEGGCGGNTGHYDNPERSKKISEFAKKRIGILNPMYGKTHTPEVRERLRQANLGKHLTEEHKQKLIKANTGRIKTPHERELLSKANKGKIISKESYEKMMDHLCKYKYEVYLHEEKIFECLGHTALHKFCHDKLHISRSIVESILKNKWRCHFGRTKHLQTLKIKKIDRGVTTNGDECSRVG